MKNYIVSEEDCLRLVLTYGGSNKKTEVIIADFLKSKKPIKGIASGEVWHRMEETSEGFEEVYYIGKYSLSSYIEKYYGKSIKIYIQEG